MTTSRSESTGTNRVQRRELLPAPMLIELLDDVVPALYTAILAARAYLQDQQGTEPHIIAADLGNQISRLFLGLIEHGALDMAEPTNISDAHQEQEE